MAGAVRLASRVSAMGRRRPVAAVDRNLAMIVQSARMVARDVLSLRLVRADEDLGALPAWDPGAHLDLVLPSGRVRQYSLCGDPADRYGYRIAVRRLPEGNGGSREVHELTPGTAVTVRGPRAAFPLVRAPRYLFVAGGIGITPIVTMVRAVAATNADWRLVYAGRDRGLMPFLAELDAVARDRLVLWVDAERGRPPTGADLLAAAPGPDAVGYLCGPPPMLAGMRAELQERPLLSALHVERFAAPPVVGGRPFVVELARDGRRYQVPADRTVLDVLRVQRPELAYSCRQGFCGTCRTRVLAGGVEHRDRVLTGPERAREMAICVSRAEGDRLVLDL